MNLDKLGLQELDSKEAKNIEGGGVIGKVFGFLWGSIESAGVAMYEVMTRNPMDGATAVMHNKY